MYLSYDKVTLKVTGEFTEIDKILEAIPEPFVKAPDDYEAPEFGMECYLKSSLNVVDRTDVAEFHTNAYAKEVRTKEVQAIKVTTATGNTFDGDEISQNRMTRVLVGLPEGSTTTWILADNTVVEVSKQELREALVLAGSAQSELWTQGK